MIVSSNTMSTWFFLWFWNTKNQKLFLEESKTDVLLHYQTPMQNQTKKCHTNLWTFLFSLPISYIFADVMLSCCDGYYDKDIWHNVKFSDLTKFINLDGRYECPRSNCSKHYKDASSLQRHIRWIWDFPIRNVTRYN